MTQATPPIHRTEKGLTISGTRVTLYSVMDYVEAGWPQDLIRDWLDLSDQQASAAFDYIATHRQQVEAEYRKVLQLAEQNQRYWRQRRHHATCVAEPIPEKERARARLRAWKEELEIA